HTRFSRDWSSDVCSSDLGDFRIGVVVAEGRVVDDRRKGGGDDRAVVLDADLAFGEALQLGDELLARPGAAEVGVDAIHDPGDGRSEERRVGKEDAAPWGL